MLVSLKLTGVATPAMEALTVEVPFNTPQLVTSLIRDLQTVSFTLSTPVFVNGKPVIPKYQGTQGITIGTAGTYTYADPVLVT